MPFRKTNNTIAGDVEAHPCIGSDMNTRRLHNQQLVKLSVNLATRVGITVAHLEHMTIIALVKVRNYILPLHGRRKSGEGPSSLVGFIEDSDAL